MGASRELGIAKIADEGDAEPTTMAPLASQMIASIMNDAEETPRPSRVQVRTPTRNDADETIAVTGILVELALANADDDAQDDRSKTSAPRPTKTASAGPPDESRYAETYRLPRPLPAATAPSLLDAPLAPPALLRPHVPSAIVSRTGVLAAVAIVAITVVALILLFA
jgi:hypothetical protein